MSRPTRILIVNPFGIGDVLFSTPLIRAVRRAFPDAHLAYLCNRRTEEILRRNTNLNELFIYEKDELVALWKRNAFLGLHAILSLVEQVRRRRFDLAVDLSLGERFAPILMAMGVSRRVGFNYRNRGRFLTDRLTIEGYHDTHVVEYYRRLLEFIGIRLMDDAGLEVVVSEADAGWATRWLHECRLEDRRPLVGMVPAGGVSWGIDAPFRRWSFEGFAQVGDALADRYGARLILFGEASDRAVCHTVAKLMRHPAIDLSGQTTLGQFVSLLGRLQLVLCNDGGPLHLAVSQHVKTVSVFGPVSPEVYGPYPPDAHRHRVICYEALPCRPCYHHFKLPPCPYERACLTMIEPEEVIAACDALLDSGPARQAGVLHGRN